MTIFSLPAIDDPISVILKLPGEVCNINCHYCYEKRKPDRAMNKITPELVRVLLEKAGGRTLSIELHGGEPLLAGKENMKGIFEEFRKYPGELIVSIQTNGTLMDQSWIDFFKQEWPNLAYATSIDGDAENTLHRVDYQENPVHDKIEHLFDLFSKNEIKVGVVAVVTKTSLTRVKEVFDYFVSKKCINHLVLSPCFDFNSPHYLTAKNRELIMLLNSDQTGTPDWGIRPNEYADFLIEFFDLWKESGAFKSLYVEPFMSILRVLGGKNTSSCHFDQKKCAHYLTLYPDGRITTCDELDPPTNHGYLTDFNSLNDILAFQRNNNLLNELKEIMRKCEGCNYLSTCNGGCLATRRRYKDTEYYEGYCDYRIKIIDYVSQQIAAIK